MCSIFNDPGPDTGWSWVIAIACFLVNFCVNGLLRSQGVLYLATIAYFGITRESASWPYSLCIATACFSGIFVGILTHVISVRKILCVTALLVAAGHLLCYLTFHSIHWLTLSYGIISGFGTGFVTPCLAIMTNSYFAKARVTANGISLSGTTCGAFFFPVLTDYLLSEFGLPGTFLVLAGFGLNALVGATMLRPRTPRSFPSLTRNHVEESSEPCLTRQPEEGRKEADGNGGQIKLTLPKRVRVGGEIFGLFSETLTDSMFLIVALSAVSSVMVLMLFAMIVVDFAVDLGITRSKAVLLLPAFSLPDLVGRLGTGWISDKGYLKRKHIFMITKSISGLLMISVPMVRMEVGLFAICAILGFLEGSATILTNVLFMDYLGLKKLPAALSLWSFSLGIVFLVTPPLIGLFRDVYGQYDRLFYLMGGVSVLTSSTWLLEPAILKWRIKQLRGSAF